MRDFLFCILDVFVILMDRIIDDCNEIKGFEEDEIFLLVFLSVDSETWPTQHPSQWTSSTHAAVSESFETPCLLEGF